VHQQDSDLPVVDVVAGLATLLLTEQTFETSLHRVSVLAVATIPSCDSAGVTLVDQGSASSQTVTDAFTLEIDSYQFELGEGPCLDAVRTGRTYRCASMATEDRWPAFSARAAASGLMSTLSVPLRVADDNVGALNLYARTHPFGDHDEEVARGFARQAAVVLINARAYAKSLELVDQLRAALESRDVIGQAKGIVMVRDRCSAGHAFRVLVSMSQSHNLKLRDVAAQVVESVTLPPG
jgi:GAF domain-containing protein